MKKSRLGQLTMIESVMALRPSRVLVVEDDPQMRGLVARKLRKIGYEVVEAVNGDDALARLGEPLVSDVPAFDLVISDIRMPSATGIDLLSTLRRTDWNIPVILITGFGNPATHAEAKRLGAVAVFDKPFDLDDLGAAVLNAVPPKIN